MVSLEKRLFIQRCRGIVHCSLILYIYAPVRTSYVHVFMCITLQDPGTLCYPDMLITSSVSCIYTNTTGAIYDRSCHAC